MYLKNIETSFRVYKGHFHQNMFFKLKLIYQSNITINFIILSLNCSIIKLVKLSKVGDELN
jgi:hypothetical protein